MISFNAFDHGFKKKKLFWS